MKSKRPLATAILAAALLLVGIFLGLRKRHPLPDEHSIHRQIKQERASGILGSEPCGHLIDVRSGSIDFMIEPYHGFDAAFITDLPQSFAGYALAVGDADNDGLNELVIGTTPDSRLYISKYDSEKKQFNTELLEEELAGFGCKKDGLNVAGGVSAILVDDLTGNGANEIVAMADDLLADSNIKLWVLSKREHGWHQTSTNIQIGSDTHRTHGLAALDIDGDATQEIFSLHDSGIVLNHEISESMDKISSSQFARLATSIKSIQTPDLFDHGNKAVVSIQTGKAVEASVYICRLSGGRPIVRLLPTRADKRFVDAATCTGDLDNDGINELIVAWIRRNNKGNIVDLDLYKFNNAGDPIEQTNLVEDTTLFGAGDLAKRMCIGKIGSTQKNKQYISSSRGDEYQSRNRFNERWGLYELSLFGEKTTLRKIANFWSRYVTAANICIGDVDNDGTNELIVGTGRGPLTRHGIRSYVFVLDK